MPNIPNTNNSTIKLQNIVDDARTFGDLAPVLATGGYSDQPALSIATDTITAMLLGGANGQPFNWKWNRINAPTFPTISWQQDYFIPNFNNIGWIEYAWCSNINVTMIPKEKKDLEVRRDLQVTYWETGYPGKICWIPNSTAQTGTWGAHPQGPTPNNPQGETNQFGPNVGGLQNPGPGVIYTNPIGQAQQPINATTCITDPNGNLWALTQFGTCGATQPNWPINPQFPTYANPTVIATTVQDGTVTWTSVNPSGQAFRLNPIPPQTGITWVIQAVCQQKIPAFTSLNQTIEPVPDDYVSYFKQGFFCQCFRRSPDPKVRAKFKDEWEIWMQSLQKAVIAGQRELDDFGFYPTQSIMDSGQGVYVGPAYPWPNPWGA